MPLLKNGHTVEDPWVRIEDDADIADETAVVVSLARWQNEADVLRTVSYTHLTLPTIYSV